MGLISGQSSTKASPRAANPYRDRSCNERDETEVRQSSCNLSSVLRSRLMKCQKCAKPATFHITDIVEKGKHREFHFCDEHARQHLAPTDETSEQPISELAKELIVSGQGPLREPSPADKQVCPICQITFLEFRNSGR